MVTTPTDANGRNGPDPEKVAARFTADANGGKQSRCGEGGGQNTADANGGNGHDQGEGPGQNTADANGCNGQCSFTEATWTGGREQRGCLNHDHADNAGQAR
jgi:hypothetical protein